MATEPDVNQLHQEIGQTRADLTEKLETLEEQVRDTIRSTTESVTGTVEHVTNTVEETIEQVSSSVQETVDSVKRTFDMNYQMQERPWLMMGGSLAAGFLVAALVNRAQGPSSSSAHRFVPSSAGFRPAPTPPEPRDRGPSFLGNLFHQFEPELDRVKELAIGYAVGALRDMVTEAMPTLKEQINDIMNSATNKLGGHPVEGPVFGESSESNWSRGGSATH